MKPAELARAGDLDALFAQMDLKSDSSADREVYKWLCCAEDFGHDAEDLIGDVLEVSSLRYDDDGYEQAAAHWELAVAYLLEEDGLLFDASLARKHLETALAEFSLEEITACTKEPYSADDVLDALTGDRKALVEEILADGPYRLIRHSLSALKELRAIGTVPKAIVAHVANTLARQVQELVGDDVEEGVLVANRGTSSVDSEGEESPS